MNIEEAREYCLSLKNATECFPFDDVSLVFKVEGKMFLLLPLDASEPCVSLKCSTDYTEELRERYTAVEGAYHFNKKYWNTIYLDRARELLTCSGGTVEDVAVLLGHSDVHYFYHAFRRLTGLSPGEYRAERMNFGTKTDESPEIARI